MKSYLRRKKAMEPRGVKVKAHVVGSKCRGQHVALVILCNKGQGPAQQACSSRIHM